MLTEHQLYAITILVLTKPSPFPLGISQLTQGNEPLAAKLQKYLKIIQSLLLDIFKVQRPNKARIIQLLAIKKV